MILLKQKMVSNIIRLFILYKQYINQCNITGNKPRNKYEQFSLKEIQKTPKSYHKKEHKENTKKRNQLLWNSNK